MIRALVFDFDGLLVELVDVERARPGVEAYLEAAQRRGLRLAVASNSRREWVAPHLARLGLLERFAHLSCWAPVRPPKPAPDLYLDAAAALGVRPTDALAFEDSPAGVAAAKAAGLRCVAVPHPLTARLDLSAADLIVPSLTDYPLPALLARLDGEG
jgi:beta-phosphoglucomutase-like phosphatase (HAD superfamily)